ncbi:hypothetical protein SASPL_105094 [Salvia splendens]|uniref:Uncharacterized protein n=1 Tax=Salvia splendens TaxID=180675 RepID=A0A8X8YKN2_SALSN|nr:hypothetical protein SASPL_105094 [Salvia splendens]
MGFIAVEKTTSSECLVVTALPSPSVVRGASRRPNAIRAGKRNVTVEPGRGRPCCCRRTLSTASDHAVFFRTVSSLQLPYRSSVLIVLQAHPKISPLIIYYLISLRNLIVEQLFCYSKF